VYRVSRQIDFCYGHRLWRYEGPCRNLHGHNGRAIITIEAPELDGLGMVRDFKQIKEAVSRWVHENLDHRMILHRDDPLAAVLREQGEPVVELDGNPTAENLARLIFQVAGEQGLPVVEVRFYETSNCCATYGKKSNSPGGP
jgi:6-pyruvoyltetrahydropterin/6-carboxytetrahydropterin synthase